MQLIPTHIRSLFHRLASAFDKSADKLHSFVISSKVHRVNFNDTNIAGGAVVAFDIDADANHPVFLEFQCHINTVFNATVTNVLTLGSNTPTSDSVFAAGDINEAALGFNTAKQIRIVARTKFYVKYTQSGTAAGTGQADFICKIFGAYNW